MKKLYGCLLAAALVLAVTGVAMADNSKQGAEIYVESRQFTDTFEGRLRSNEPKTISVVY